MRAIPLAARFRTRFRPFMNTIPKCLLFLERQNSQIQEEGFSAIWRKAKKIVHFVISTMAIPVVLVLRLLRPLVWFRFGFFRAERIGHFVFDVEYYLCERELGIQPQKAIDFFFYPWGKPANAFFANMCERQLQVRWWSEYLYIANRWLPGGYQFEVNPALTRFGSRDVKGLFQQTNTQLYFTDEEDLLGREFLNNIGCMNGDKFVCLVVRDAVYLSQFLDGSWDYHNYRDTDIDTFKEAALALAEKGYWVFRMGKAVLKPFIVGHPRIVDYAKSPCRSDFLDIWLSANCFFCITTGTGLDEVPRAFRRPSVYVNCLPTSNLVSYDHCITLPKHLVWQRNRQRLTLSEHLVCSYGASERYEQKGILVQDLSKDEILQTVIEMESRLKGTWQETKEDIQLQSRFWKIFKKNADFDKLHGQIHPEFRVSGTFLKANTQWLN